MKKSDKQSTEDRQMLSSKIINSLPVVRSVWGYGVDTYNSAKELALLKPSIEIAEFLAQPVVSSYKSIDGFASNQVDKVANAYEAVSSVGVVQAAAWPIGYAYGLTLGTMNALENNVQGTRFEKPVERLYDLVGAIVDGVMPAPAGEKPTTERTLRSKNPVRRIGKRASLKSVRGLPGNSIRFAMSLTKKYTRMAAFKSLDFGLVFMWNRATSSVRMAERVFNYFIQYSIIRTVIERPLPLLYELTGRAEWSKRVRHDSGALISYVLGTTLSQLDFLYKISGSGLPKTSEAIEQLAIFLFNIQQYLDQDKKRRLSVYDDEEKLHKREKRSKLTVSSNGFPIVEKAQAIVAPIVEKVQDIVAPVTEIVQDFVAPVAETVQTLSTSSEVQTPIVNVRDAKTAAINPFAALLKNTDMTDDLAHVEPIHNHHAHTHAHAAHKTHKKTEETQEETQIHLDDSKIAERAKHELQMWKQQEKDKAEERERHLRERHAREHQLRIDQERQAREQEKKDREDRKAKRIQDRAEEKARAEQEAKEAQEKKENERLAKEIAHAEAHRQYEAKKAIRDAELAKKHKEVEFAKRMAQVEKDVKAARAEKQRQWEEEHADEIKAKKIGDGLIEEERREKEAEQRKHEKEVALAEKEAAKKEAAKEATKKEEVKEEEVKLVEVKKEVEEEEVGEKEIVLVSGHKVADEVTHWTVASADDEPWQSVTHKKASHLSSEHILHPAPIRDADQSTTDKNNEYFALNAQGEGVNAP